MPRVGASIGRVRVTKASSPGEPGYIRSMQLQMEEIARRLNAEVKNVKKATAFGMAYALEPILEHSQKIVPVDTGKLKRSGFIEVRETVSGPKAVIGYAKYGSPHYAAMVHEMLSMRHKPGKSAKFLEIAVHAKLGVFKRRLIRFIKQNTGFKQ